jgi:23S rRNA (guanosine2251-2'-O)-methyltransferase
MNKKPQKSSNFNKNLQKAVQQKKMADKSKEGFSSDFRSGSHKGGTRDMGGLSIPKEWRVVMGTHAVLEVLKVRPKKVAEAWIKKDWASSSDLLDLKEKLSKLRIKIIEKEPSVLDRLSPSHQGAVLFVTGAPEFDLQKLKNIDKGIIVYLDGLEDPHNLGAIIRTSWLMGVKGIVIPEDRAVGLTPSVHKVACGGVEHVPIFTTNQFGPSLAELKESGFWVYGLAAKGQQHLYQLSLPEKMVWIVGSEDKGMRVQTEKQCDELVKIPQISDTASYNASVSAAVALSEASRQIYFK